MNLRFGYVFLIFDAVYSSLAYSTVVRVCVLRH